MNGKLLKAKMVECNVKPAELAKVCEISVNSCYRKIRGESQFLPSEISAVTNTLHLTPKEFFCVFFPDLIKSKKEN